MEKKEIILSRISDILGQPYFVFKNNGELKARYKCVGLGEYFEKYSIYLTPFFYNQGHSYRFENSNDEYSVFLGIDSTLTDLYHEGKNEEIISFLKEIIKSINYPYVQDELKDDFEQLILLYRLLGLNIETESKKIKVTVFTQLNDARVSELFFVESWLQDKHPGVYDAYNSAISSYTNGHSGTCIEACRTALVSFFSEYKGTESFAKWMRGIFNVSGESYDFSVAELDTELKKILRQDDLADFFHENKNGKLTKTRCIYMIYSMMSDYGTHRNESTKETPSLADALFMLRLTDSILFWVYSLINL